MSFPFRAVILSAASRARNGTRPVPPRRMQRSPSKLGRLCNPSSSLWSLQRRTVASPASSALGSHGSHPSRNGGLLQSRRSQAQDGWAIAKKGGMSVVDRATNWAHVKPIRKRRAPPLGIPRLSLEKILKAYDSVDDEIFDTELGELMLPTGSFFEVRRSVHLKRNFSRLFTTPCVGTTA